MHTIHVYEAERLRVRFEKALSHLVDTFMGFPKYRELLCRLLTSRVLAEAAGYLDPEGIGYLAEIDQPLDRIEWVDHLICYHFLDDGEPGLAWHAYSSKRASDLGPFYPCAEGAEGAKPFFHRYRSSAEVPTATLPLTIELADQTLDYYEKQKADFLVEWGDDDPPEPERPVYTHLDALVAELRERLAATELETIRHD